MKSIEHLESYLWTDSPPLTHAKIMALAAATRRAGVWFTPTRRWYDAYWAQYERMGFDSTAFPIMADLTVAMQEAGVGLLLGTDGPATWVVEELAALVRMGLTPYQALVTATRNPAAYFGTLDDNGTVALGKRADLVLLNENPLQNIQSVSAPVGVMIGGRWLSREDIDRRMGERGDSVASLQERPSVP